ncbi:MAG: hypothetical protein IT317_15245 [Anaerolineales bacterium]|nr:hypothetical protein [Anaerolineales bacterium]
MPNIIRSFGRWASTGVLAAALLLSGPTGALAGGEAALSGSPSLQPALDPVLWDQSTAGGTGFSITVSSKFEAPLAAYDSQAADDFENAGSTPWEITAIRAYGTYEGGTGSNSVNSLLVQIYADDEGLPGTRLISQTIASGAITGLATGEFTVNLSPSLVVGPGRYWLSVQAYKPDFLTYGRQWEWYEKEDQVLSPSVWMQPGNAYGKNCLIFQPRVDVCDQPTNTVNDDLVFAVFGKIAASNPVPVASNLTPSVKPTGGAAFQLVVKGFNFASGAKVVWQGSELTPSASSGSRLTVTVPSGYIATGGTAAVKVRNPGPGGGDSNALTFTIGARIFHPIAHRP